MFITLLKSIFFMWLLTDLHAFRLRSEQSCGTHANLSDSHQQLPADAARVNKHLHAHCYCEWIDSNVTLALFERVSVRVLIFCYYNLFKAGVQLLVFKKSRFNKRFKHYTTWLWSLFTLLTHNLYICFVIYLFIYCHTIVIVM